MSLPREWYITCFLLRRLGAEVVNIMVTTALPVRPGHKRSSTRPLSWACTCHYILISSSRLEPVFSVNLLNLSLWKMSHPLHKEFQYSHILSNILAHGVELIITRKSFFQTVLCLNMNKVNYYRSDSQSLNKRQLLLFVEVNCLLPYRNRYSASCGVCRDPCTYEQTFNYVHWE